MFEAGYSALGDFCNAEVDTDASPRLHVVSAPVGGGKTSFSMALMVAVTKLAEATLDAPYGCLFLVDQMDKADQMYRDSKKSKCREGLQSGPWTMTSNASNPPRSSSLLHASLWAT